MENPEIPAKGANIVEKVTVYTRTLNTYIDKALGLIGDHPWKKWLGVANNYIALFLPCVIGVAGVLAVFFGLIATIKYETPYTLVLAALLAAAFSLHLAPKAIGLVLSLVDKSEAEVVRPELLYIMRVIFGLGGVLTALALVLEFDADFIPAIVTVLVIAVLMTIACSCPEMVGVKAGYPKNAVDELLSIILLPVRIILSLFSILMGLATIGCLVYGFIQLFDAGTMIAAPCFAVAAVLPFVVAFACYLLMLVVNLTIDSFRALVSVPGKLDEVRKVLEEKK